MDKFVKIPDKQKKVHIKKIMTDRLCVCEKENIIILAKHSYDVFI